MDDRAGDQGGKRGTSQSNCSLLASKVGNFVHLCPVLRCKMRKKWRDQRNFKRSR
ncbi:unnamed protein product, partial [Ascophyllum nodosum]